MSNGGQTRGRLSSRAVRAREREVEAVRLREAGLTFEEIAGRLGFADRSAARKAIERALARDVPEVEGLRARLMDEVEAVIDRLSPLPDDDEFAVKVIDRLLKALDLYARLGGVYRPEQPTVVVNQVAVTVSALEEHGRRLLKARAADTSSPPGGAGLTAPGAATGSTGSDDGGHR